MRNHRFVLLAILLTTFVAAQKTSVDWDKASDFAQFTTYAWTEGTPAQNPLVHERIVAAIDSQLGLKGLKKIDPKQGPDLLVLYHGATSVETQLNTTSMNNGWGWSWGGGMDTATTTVSKIPIGQLTVDLVDAKTKKLVWLGSASDTISDKPEKNHKKIMKAAEKMFKKFPPKQESD